MFDGLLVIGYLEVHVGVAVRAVARRRRHNVAVKIKKSRGAGSGDDGRVVADGPAVTKIRDKFISSGPPRRLRPRRE